ncbi:DUF2252 domain-containing protein [Methylocystis bryophila]|uniref:DUF2252 domain-containing protein n=1 Tax=Methylocystis bryophila TaxID=655015 RepID=A0A1W6MVZ6_9HYPH|nr:DUF2252 domain-containing protein [Methylocystis bryophila]ARN81752.1 hypothetical protein B1812_12425 [Methylocystis bryophila]BDV37806.1 hypothetical protein DSM21852_10590 [Methylocystis bryophila]
MQASSSATSLAQLSVDARYEAGKKRRAEVSRESLGEFSATARDPIAIIEETNKGRLPNLLPIRRQRMAASPFAFLRGAAALMAVDLATEKPPGFPVQSCGDGHLMNYGAFVSPEGAALFDINDFDETLPGVDFTVDVKRLAASCAVAALAAGDSEKKARAVAKESVKAYRERMAQLAALSPYEAWHARVDLRREAADLFEGDLAKTLREAAAHKRADHGDDKNFPHLVGDSKKGGWRIADHPPLIYHDNDVEDAAIHVDLPQVFESVLATLPAEVGILLARYRLADSAVKVVGVGSVGTYCAIGLYVTEDGEPLFLQLKEAMTSALERLGGKPWAGQQGARVVTGQRIMQTAADSFLGYTQDPVSKRQFYVRHLKNRRLGSISDLLEAKALTQYAILCGRTLARAHARSADATTLAGYMGKSETFEDAIASFAMLYAAQNKKDFDKFVAANANEPKLKDQLAAATQ